MKNRKRAGSQIVADLRDAGYGVAISHGEYEGHPNRDRPESQDGLVRHYTSVRIHDRYDPKLGHGIELARGTALCRPGDQFDRRLGVTIAAGRARVALNRRLIGA